MLIVLAVIVTFIVIISAYADSQDFNSSTKAEGDYSTAFGHFTTAQPYASFVIGQYNEISGDANSWNATDPLFVVGNGMDMDNSSNAVTVLKNGNVGIGITNPTVPLEVNGTIHSTSGGFQFPDGTIQTTAPTSDGNIKNVIAGKGLTGGGSTLDVTLDVDMGTIQNRITGDCGIGSSIRTINQDGTVICSNNNVTTDGLWIKDGNKIFLIGTSGKKILDINTDGNISRSIEANKAEGYRSAAFGGSTTASGIDSVAFGEGTTASGAGSTAFGYYTKAEGIHSAAFGLYPTASGKGSAAFGYYTKAEGDYSTAFGHSTTAKPYTSFVIGQYNKILGNSTPNQWVSSDPLFVIGNGVSNDSRSNAVTVLKNGNVGIGTTDPLVKLHVNVDSDNDPSLHLSNSTRDITWPTDEYLELGTWDGEAWSEKVRIKSNGNVGIGTTTPNSKLQVQGYIQLDTSSGSPPPSDCDASNEYGRMKVDSTASSLNLYVCTPSGWMTLSP